MLFVYAPANWFIVLKISKQLLHIFPRFQPLKSSFGIFAGYFSKILIIYQVETKKITNVKEVLIPGLN